jgi:hypothetical protein
MRSALYTVYLRTADVQLDVRVKTLVGQSREIIDCK